MHSLGPTAPGSTVHFQPVSYLVHQSDSDLVCLSRFHSAVVVPVACSALLPTAPPRVLCIALYVSHSVDHCVCAVRRRFVCLTLCCSSVLRFHLSFFPSSSLFFSSFSVQDVVVSLILLYRVGTRWTSPVSHLFRSSL